ncbi:MAG: rhodanese-like domain-containing protein [Lutibacter sp.]
MKTTLKLSILVLITVLGISCNTKSQSQADAITVITPTEFKEKSVNQTIIDVRTPEEYNEGHIDGAININFNDAAFLEQISKLDKSKPVYVYCRSGKRSSAASAEMSKAGFKNLYDLEGGIMNWEKNNNKTIK